MKIKDAAEMLRNADRMSPRYNVVIEEGVGDRPE